MAALTSGVYFRHKLEIWLRKKAGETAEATVEFPADGSDYWRRVGAYHALKDVLAHLDDLDKDKE